MGCERVMNYLFCSMIALCISSDLCILGMVCMVFKIKNKHSMFPLLSYSRRYIYIITLMYIIYIYVYVYIYIYIYIYILEEIKYQKNTHTSHHLFFLSSIYEKKERENA